MSAAVSSVFCGGAGDWATGSGVRLVANRTLDELHDQEGDIALPAEVVHLHDIRVA